MFLPRMLSIWVSKVIQQHVQLRYFGAGRCNQEAVMARYCDMTLACVSRLWLFHWELVITDCWMLTDSTFNVLLEKKEFLCCTVSCCWVIALCYTLFGRVMFPLLHDVLLTVLTSLIYIQLILVWYYLCVLFLEFWASI